jgi:hypothetical protein
MNMKYPAKALRNSFKCYISLQGANPWLLVHYVRAWSQCVIVHKYFSHPRSVIYFFFSNHSHKTKTGTGNWWETTDSNPLQPLKLSSQLTTDVTLHSAMYWPHHLVHKCKAQSRSDWCRWFATNSLLPICGLSFHFRAKVEKKTRLNWDMRNIVARSHCEHLWDCSKDWHTLGEETQSDGHNIKGVRKIWYLQSRLKHNFSCANWLVPDGSANKWYRRIQLQAWECMPQFGR